MRLPYDSLSSVCSLYRSFQEGSVLFFIILCHNKLNKKYIFIIMCEKHSHHESTTSHFNDFWSLRTCVIFYCEKQSRERRERRNQVPTVGWWKFVFHNISVVKYKFLLFMESVKISLHPSYSSSSHLYRYQRNCFYK